MASCSSGGAPDGLILASEPTRLDFGEVPIFQPVLRELTLINQSSETVVIGSIRGEGPLQAALSIVDQPGGLAAGGQTELQLAFAPPRAGIWAGDLAITLKSPLPETLRIPVFGIGTAGLLQANPSSVEFGPVLVGQSRTATISVINGGGVSVLVTALTAGIQSAPGFSAVLTGQTRLAPGESFEFSTTFAPERLGEAHGTIIAAEDQRNPPALTVPVSGTAVRSLIATENSQVSFLGLFAGESQTQRIRLRNISFDPMELRSIQLIGSSTTTPLFSVQTASVGQSWAPGDLRIISLSYAPPDRSVVNARLRIDGGPKGGVLSIPVLGYAQPRPASQPTWSQAVVNFGQVPRGSTVRRSLWLRNTGDLLLSGHLHGELGQGFSLNYPQEGPIVLPSQEYRHLEVSLTASQLGTVQGHLRLDDSDPGVSLQAEVVEGPLADLWTEPATLDFQAVPRGVRAGRRIVIRNSGTQALEINGLTIHGPEDSLFSLVRPPSLPLSLQPGAELNQLIRFEDGNGRLRHAQAWLNIDSDDPDGAPRVIPLQAETTVALLPEKGLEARLSWGTAPIDLNLHLLHPGASLYDAPGDACYCNPRPAWHFKNTLEDDPLLVEDALLGPGEERILLSDPKEEDYAIVVDYPLQASGQTIEAEVQVSFNGKRLGLQRRALGPGQVWQVGSFRRTSSGRFTPAALPLDSRQRFVCD